MNEVRRRARAISAIAAVIAAVAAAAPTGGASAASKTFHHCGSQNHSGAGWYHVRAHGLACGPAREVARTFWKTGEHSFNGWSCHTRQVGEELWKAHCTRPKHGGLQIVRFEYGA